MGADIRRKVEKATEFIEKIKKIQKEAGIVLKKTQEEMKKQADRELKEVEEWKKSEKMMLSTKDLVFKKRLARKLVDQYISPYINQCNQTTIADFNEDSSGCECLSSSKIQRASGGLESKRSKTGRDKEWEV